MQEFLYFFFFSRAQSLTSGYSLLHIPCPTRSRRVQRRVVIRQLVQLRRLRQRARQQHRPPESRRPPNEEARAQPRCRWLWSRPWGGRGAQQAQEEAEAGTEPECVREDPQAEEVSWRRCASHVASDGYSEAFGLVAHGSVLDCLATAWHDRCEDGLGARS